MYAGGGGGGTKQASDVMYLGPGGAGGGGRGAGKNLAPGAGEPNTGGGGGGGTLEVAGAAGGSGIVIVRITEANEVKVNIPVINDLTYTGDNISVSLSSAFEYVSGKTNETAVGDYSFFVKPATDFEWKDNGGSEAREVTWKIVQLKLDMPTVASGLVYGGTNQVGVVISADSAKYCELSSGSETNATNAGVHTYTISIKGEHAGNVVWADDSTEAAGSWTINPIVVTRPMPNTGLIYNGTEKQGFSSLDYARYKLTAGETNATAGGTHQFTFELLGNDDAENYVWNTDPKSAAPYEGTWMISAAANSITALSLKGWRICAEPEVNAPVISADWGVETVHYKYGFGATESAVPEDAWIDNPTNIAEAGTWIVKAIIDETPNWAAATRTASFEMWDDPGKIYNYRVDIFVKGGSVALTNFPVPVRISERRIGGFEYKHADSKGQQLVFLDTDGNILPYEVDTWNTAGESLVWVGLATLPTTGMKITMFWGLGDGKEPFEYTPKAVWDDNFVGIWHMNASGTKVPDTTGRSDGTLKNLATTQAGLLGNAVALPPDSSSYVTCGNKQSNAELATGFTIEGWANASIFTGNANNRNALFGKYNFMSVRTENNTAITITTPNIADHSSIPVSLTTGDWFHYALTFVPGTGGLKFYLNGNLISTQDPIKKNNKYFDNSTDSTEMYFGMVQWGYHFRGLLDEYRLSKSIRPKEWIETEYASMFDESFALTNSPVYHGEKKINVWLEVPELDKTDWDAKDTPGSFISEGKLLYGDVTNVIYSVYTGETFAGLSDVTNVGLYRIDFLPTETEGYEPISHRIEIHVVESQPYANLGDSASGRVLLMNNHIGEANHPDVDYQGWFDADNGVDTAGSASTPTYWHYENLAPPAVTTFNLKDGTVAGLYASDKRRLWYLIGCRHGNTFPTETSDPLEPLQNYLPYATTYSKRITEHRGNQRGATRSTVGQLVMQNTTDAVVYSSCFTNGIGTIYFDAVNGWCRSDENYENYKIVVEIATNTVYGLEPTDVNSMTIIETTNDVENVGIVITTTTNYYGNLEGQWIAAGMIPFKRDGTAEFVAPTNSVGEIVKTSELALSVEHGGTMDNFYRVVVPLDIAGPVRFRIRRSKADEDRPVDVSSFILLDNIIASIPAMRGDLVSAGHYDAEKKGSQVLGWELATSTPYPSGADADLMARATPVYTLNVGDGSTPDTSTFFSSATMHYRWRYLNQHSNDWQTVVLNPSDGFKALSALDLPGRVGDVEYWFDYKLQAPFYKYVDYSGASNASINYTEERGILTNRLDGATLVSGGTDWFFRLREGKSDYAGFDIVYSRGDSENVERIHMALAEDHVWRGFVQTKENQTGTIKYHIEALDEQTEPFAEYAATTNYFNCKTDDPKFPVSDSLVPGAADSWSTLTLDAVTGYVMFQIDDTSKALTVVHADYQNANGWSDALDRKGQDKNGNTVSKIFVGTSTTNAYKIGVSPSKQTFSEDFLDWGTMPATNETWTFPTGLTDIQPSHMHGRKAYETFASETNGLWDVGQGMWVAKKYMISSGADAGVALQMEGNGKGYFQFLDKDRAPRGLESISFNARLGQFIEFDDFNYYDGEVKMSLMNYTFYTRAAFDTNSNKDFRGNGSLSVVANYLPNKGCYEARWEQIANEVNNNGMKGGQRLCLYRWNVSRNGKTETLLTAWTNVNTFAQAKTTAFSGSAKFMPFYITVSNDTANACTWVAAGVCDTAIAPNASWQSSKWYIVACRDNDSQNRLVRGTYGVLSSNCDGVFMVPQYSPNVVFSKDDELKLAAGKAGFYTQKTRSDPSGFVMRTDGFGSQDDVDVNWNVIPGRMKTRKDGTSEHAVGIVADPNVQDLEIYLGTAGRADWGSTPYKTIAINGFGGATTNIAFYTTKDCSVRFAVAGTGRDIRTDVVVDSVVVRQWRGGDWDDDDVWPLLPAWADDNRYKEDKKGYPLTGHTNFVFTSAWVTNHTVLLSAKRAKVDEPSSIRSPLMDGFSDDNTGYVRGKGLGMISIGYANAQENAVLTLQIATNGVDYSSIYNFDKSFSSKNWTTITNYNFGAMTATQRKSGILNTYLGLHDVKGAMRIIVNTNVIASVENETNTSRFGDVTITSISCSDEPAVDVHSWWGWNLRTVGGDEDSEKKMFLGDFSTDVGGAGLSVALNNSVDGDNCQISKIDYRDRESYIQHKPFIQTPTFTSNIVGEVSFKARKYSSSDGTATIVLFGSVNASKTDEGTWSRIDGAVFSITNDWYETYSYKTDPGQNYKAFRLAVVGIEGISDISGGGNGGLPDDGRKPERVLLDELFVSEAVRARMGFKNVGCFKSDMSGLGEVPNVPSRLEQPLCGEAWGVQCEIYGAQLASDIDFDHTPRVRLHWFDKGSGVVTGGWSPWGYDKWKDQGSYHKSAWLVKADGVEEGRYVYRSSLMKSPESVISMSTTAPTYVQYMLEVIFYTKGSSVPVTNFLSRTEWGVDGKGPEWYSPLDLNAQNGGPNGSFAAYNILDNVAPGWAWFNEVNVFGLFNEYLENSDENCQYVEIAQPPEADISGWSVRILEAQTSNGLVVTNTLATFGADGLEGTKDAQWIDPQANMVFRVIANQQARKTGQLKRSDGTLDGVWKLENTYLTNMSGDSSGDTTISATKPFGLQLVRKSGIVEHEIVAMGTNWWNDLSIIYQRQYHPTNAVNFLNANISGAQFFYVGMDDDAGETKSLGVFQNNGMTNDWNNTMKKSPGRRNPDQYIDPDHPVPSGESVLVYFSVSGDNILQWDGESFTNGLIMTMVAKGSQRGTNITYRVAPWYEIGSVTTNGVSAAAGLVKTTAGNTQPREYVLEGVGKGVSNNVTVIAAAIPDERLATQYDVGEDNPYRTAIIDWLGSGTDLYGNPFADVDSGEIKLAEFRSMNNTFVTNMTLTEMYWLDMDPTVGGLALLGGMAEAPTPRDVTLPGGATRKYLRMGVYMMITNENAVVTPPTYPRGANDFTTHWTPYALRGLAPGSNSLGYEQARDDWESVTFKLTGLLLNGKTNPLNVDNWMPLRWFVFREDSFTAEGLSRIEIEDPHSPDSIGYNTGWGQWWEKHGFSNPAFFWSIDTRLQPIGVEALKQENYYGN